MGYLSNLNNEIIADATLTKYGREKLASGQQLGIVKFALSDDEIDYTLYNMSHPLGSDYFDIAIRKLPILEPVPNSSTQFRYTLYTPAKTGAAGSDAYNGRYMTISPTTYAFTQANMNTIFLPSIYPPITDDEVLSKTWFVARIDRADSSYIRIQGILDKTLTDAYGIPNDLAKILQANNGNTYSYTADSMLAYGHSFKIWSTQIPTVTKSYVITFDVANIPSAPVSATVQIGTTAV